MLKFLHGYAPELWEGYKKHGLLREQDGIRFMQNFLTPDEFRFNKLAAKDSELYNLIKEENRPFYIDRLQGGAIMYEYDYDEKLLDDYRILLGDKFLGFQMHEWLSNYRSDQKKCEDVSEENWNEENITAAIKKVFPCKNLLLEAMTMEEMLGYGKVTDPETLYKNMTEIYLKRLAKYKELVPVDGGYNMFHFEAENGAKIIMPEIGGCSYGGFIITMAYARGITKAYGITLGAYYEPWGGEPFSVCTCFPEDKNDWFISDPEDFPFKFAGPNGGSSLSLQWRSFLYCYLSGAEYISEEWGAYNTFSDANCDTLSEYGKVKKKFIDFLAKYPDVGEKLSPVAVVLSNALPTYVTWEGDTDETLYGYTLPEEEAEKLRFVKSNARKLFYDYEPQFGNERGGLLNSDMPDAIDMLNVCDGKALENYAFLVDLTNEPDFAMDINNLLAVDKVKETLKQVLPVRVEGSLHHVVNKKLGGGYYLTIFNHSGIIRTVAKGDEKMPEAEKTVEIILADDFKNSKLILLEGDGNLKCNDGRYFATLPAGGFMFIEF